MTPLRHAARGRGLLPPRYPLLRLHHFLPCHIRPLHLCDFCGRWWTCESTTVLYADLCLCAFRGLQKACFLPTVCGRPTVWAPAALSMLLASTMPQIPPTLQFTETLRAPPTLWAPSTLRALYCVAVQAHSDAFTFFRTCLRSHRSALRVHAARCRNTSHVTKCILNSGALGLHCLVGFCFDVSSVRIDRCQSLHLLPRPCCGRAVLMGMHVVVWYLIVRKCALLALKCRLGVVSVRYRGNLACVGGRERRVAKIG